MAKVARTPVYIVHNATGKGIDIAMRARQEGVEMWSMGSRETTRSSV